MKFDLPEDFLYSVFASTASEREIQLDSAIVSLASDVHVIATNPLDLDEYQRLGLCERSLITSPRPVGTRYWGGEDHDRLFDDFEQAVWRIDWNGNDLIVIDLSWSGACGRTSRAWVVAETNELADEFILDVARKTNDPGESILVFAKGYWRRSKALFNVIKESSFDDLIMDASLKESIRSDFRQFLGARDQYESLGLSWRRGALFIGPPGNGKTQTIRALVNELSVPSLYVQSLRCQHLPSDYMLKEVFERARQLRPCVLIFEDLDTLIDDENRSFFLNQLDGLEKNVGLIVLATTNYPERIERAIIDRPSRFDRKYHFDLPCLERRTTYLRQ